LNAKPVPERTPLVTFFTIPTTLHEGGCTMIAAVFLRAVTTSFSACLLNCQIQRVDRSLPVKLVLECNYTQLGRKNSAVLKRLHA
jgi:hypothetical protein